MGWCFEPYLSWGGVLSLTWYGVVGVGGDVVGGGVEGLLGGWRVGGAGRGAGRGGGRRGRGGRRRPRRPVARHVLLVLWPLLLDD